MDIRVRAGFKRLNKHGLISGTMGLMEIILDLILRLDLYLDGLQFLAAQ
jgi:hypothetical protein